MSFSKKMESRQLFRYNCFFSAIYYGTKVLVKDHFCEAYGFNNRYPNIIGINLAGRKSVRQEVVPIELCNVTEGQFFKRKVPNDLMARAVTAFASTNRWDTIQKAASLRGLIK